MSKFATKAKAVSTARRSRTINQEGHPAYQKTATEELYSALVSSFLNGDKFYESEQKTMERIAQLVSELNDQQKQKFLIGLTYLARKLGNRTSFHYAAALVGQVVKSEPDAVKNLLSFGVERADDLTEIAAAWAANFGKIETRPAKTRTGKENNLAGKNYNNPSLRGIPRRIREGLAKAFLKFDAYQLAKYKGTGKSIKLRDIVCVCHPDSSKSKAGVEAVKQLLDGTLPPAETWESKVSAAGKDKVAKKEAWESLLREDKMGYMAILRNLRNFIEGGVDKALYLPKLADPERVAKSKQFPFRFLSAYKIVEGLTGMQHKDVLSAIEAAIDYACNNIPEMDGSTVVAVDLSGSMDSPLSQKSTLRMNEVGASFGAMLYKRSDQVITYGFGESTRQISLSPRAGVLTNAKVIVSTHVGHSTNGHLVVQDLIRHKIDTDRVVFFTDCVLWDTSAQACIDDTSVRKAIRQYWEEVNAKTHFWFIDLNGYSTMVDPGDARVHLLAGFNENILKMIPRGEESLAISDDIIKLCEDIYEKLAKGEYPGNVQDVFEELVSI